MLELSQRCFVAAGLCYGAFACTPIETNVRKETTLLKQAVDVQARDAWQFYTTYTLRKPEGEPIYISGTVQRQRGCHEIVTKTWSDAEITERTPKGSLVGTTVLGLISAGVMTTGLIQHARGYPLETDDKDGKSQVTWTGGMVYLGAVGSLLLVDSAVTMLRSIDSSSTTERTTSEALLAPCDIGPAPNSVVELYANEQTIAQTKSDASGNFRLSVSLESLPVARSYKLGVPGFTPTDVEGLFTPDLRLFGVALKGCFRAELEAALQRVRAEAVAVPEAERSRFISEFEVEAGGLPGKQRLKLLFDGSDHFVRAKFLVRASQVQYSQQVARLTKLYGEQAPIHPPEILYRKRVNGIEVTLTLAARSDDALTPATLTFIDEAADEALRREVKAQD